MPVGVGIMDSESRNYKWHMLQSIYLLLVLMPHASLCGKSGTDLTQGPQLEAKRRAFSSAGLGSEFKYEGTNSTNPPALQGDAYHGRATRRQLLDWESAPIGDQESRLIVASMKGDKDIVEMLLHNGADVEAKDQYGYTALIEASRNGHNKITIRCSGHG